MARRFESRGHGSIVGGMTPDRYAATAALSAIDKLFAERRSVRRRDLARVTPPDEIIVLSGDWRREYRAAMQKVPAEVTRLLPDGLADTRDLDGDVAIKRAWWIAGAFEAVEEAHAVLQSRRRNSGALRPRAAATRIDQDAMIAAAADIDAVRRQQAGWQSRTVGPRRRSPVRSFAAEMLPGNPAVEQFSEGYGTVLAAVQSMLEARALHGLIRLGDGQAMGVNDSDIHNLRDLIRAGERADWQHNALPVLRDAVMEVTSERASQLTHIDALLPVGFVNALANGPVRDAVADSRYLILGLASSDDRTIREVTDSIKAGTDSRPLAAFVRSLSRKVESEITSPAVAPPRFLGHREIGRSHSDG